MPRYSIPAQCLGLAGWLALVFIAAAIGGIASAAAGDFYMHLVRPAWAPPAWLFAPAWTTLYILMGISAWLVWRKHGFYHARTALILFVLQLAVNASWTWLFFAWRMGFAALAEILLLWGLIVATIIAFRRLHAAAALLLLPYLAWVTYAAVLTFSVWKLNPGIL